MDNHMYSVEDFEWQKIEHARITELWSDNYSPKETNPYSEPAKAATKKLREMEIYLKKNGLIPYSDHELLEETLNQKFPTAQSKDIVTYNGSQYKKKFTPIELSKTGKSVKKWHSGWELLAGEP